MSNPNGRPSKFEGTNLKAAQALYKKGATDKEVAEVLEVTEQTINNWKIAHPDFFESLKDWKINADSNVVRSLYERATGYSCRETKLFCHEGSIIAEDIIKQYPPDPTAMIFWLKNRQPKEWRDKTEVVATNANMSLEEFLKQEADKLKDQK